jgi:hypothetical protein
MSHTHTSYQHLALFAFKTVHAAYALSTYAVVLQVLERHVLHHTAYHVLMRTNPKADNITIASELSIGDGNTNGRCVARGGLRLPDAAKIDI